MRPELPPLPAQMKQLPVDERGYPVPAFVGWIDGKPEFRAASSTFREQAIKDRLCWVCGQPFTTRHRWYVIGPMCAINRNTSEPPCHYDCALYSAKGCPFLTRPHAVRRDSNMPDGSMEPTGSIKRNPGVVCLYSTRTFKLYRNSRYVGDYAIALGEADAAEWYAEGREATYTEVVQSISSGYHLLVEAAETEGFPALSHLFNMTNAALRWLPPNDYQTEAQHALGTMAMQMGEAVKRNPQ